MSTKTTKYQMLSLGIKSFVEKEIPKDIQIVFTLNKDEETKKEKMFIEDEIDTQKAINSANETTFDYLLKHDTSGKRVQTTVERLKSLNKGNSTGILYDAGGREIITRDTAQKNKTKISEELALLNKEKQLLEKQKGVLANATALNTTENQLNESEDK